MIAKAVKGKGFRGALEYDLTKEQGQLLDTNMAGKNPRQLAAEFGEIRKLKPNLGKAVLHVSLSAALGEKLTDAQWREIGQHYLKGMGLDNNQYVMTRHMDTEHEHIHLVVNRIEFDGKVSSDSQDYKRQDALMRQIEKQFGLAEIAPAYGLDGKKVSGRKAPTKGEIEEGIRTDQPSIRLQLQRLCDTAAKDCESVTQYRDRLAAVGVEILPSFQLAGEKLNGLTYKLDGVVMKGGDLGKAYSPVGLSKIGVTYDKNRDFESLSRGAERHQAEAAAGLAELGRAVNRTTAASIRRPGELKETNLRADRAIEQSAQATGAADREIGRAGAQVDRAELRQAAQELARRADALQALNTQLTLEKEIENDRIRNEAVSLIDSNVRAAARAGTATNRHIRAAGASWTSTLDAIEASRGHLNAGGRIAHDYGQNLGRAIEGAKRRIAERHYDRVVESARRQFKRVSGVVQQLVDHIDHVVRAVASAAHQVAQQVAVHLELARQRVAALPRETRSAREVWAASPDNPINQIAQQPAQTAPASADKAAAAYRSSRAKTGAPPPLTEQEAQAKLLEVSNEMQAQWNAAVAAERALYLQEMTAQARAKAVAHVAEHQAHIDAKPMLLGRDKWEAQRQRFENRDSANKLAWQKLKDGKYPFLAQDEEAVQKAVERRVSDKKPELAQSMPKVAAVLQVARERLAAEKHAQGLAERQREREAREAREISNRKDKARDNKGPSR